MVEEAVTDQRLREPPYGSKESAHNHPCMGFEPANPRRVIATASLITLRGFAGSNPMRGRYVREDCWTPRRRRVVQITAGQLTASFLQNQVHASQKQITG